MCAPQTPLGVILSAASFFRYERSEYRRGSPHSSAYPVSLRDPKYSRGRPASPVSSSAYERRLLPERGIVQMTQLRSGGRSQATGDPTLEELSSQTVISVIPSASKRLVIGKRALACRAHR